MHEPRVKYYETREAASQKGTTFSLLQIDDSVSSFFFFFFKDDSGASQNFRRVIIPGKEEGNTLRDTRDASDVPFLYGGHCGDR